MRPRPNMPAAERHEEDLAAKFQVPEIGKRRSMGMKHPRNAAQELDVVRAFDNEQDPDLISRR